MELELRPGESFSVRVERDPELDSETAFCRLADETRYYDWMVAGEMVDHSADPVQLWALELQRGRDGLRMGKLLNEGPRLRSI